jgi:outer membrane protein OmpA-like peptidoglycan-associated protein
MSKSQRDSAMAANKARQDSITLANKSMQDSAALANKAEQDSVALATSQGNLSDAEKQLLSTGMLLLDACYFETGKTDISINSKPYLNIIAKMLLKYPKLQIEVSGYTDNVGGANYNMNLSQGRAAAVESYMVMVAPALSGNLTAKGYGLNDPKADNSTADGRKMNRRTELQVTNKDALKQYNP